jgi:hypothetical protein
VSETAQAVWRVCETAQAVQQEANHLLAQKQTTYRQERDRQLLFFGTIWTILQIQQLSGLVRARVVGVAEAKVEEAEVAVEEQDEE